MERLEPGELHRVTPTGATSGYSVPTDMLQTGIRRLGFLGLVIAAMAPSLYLAELWMQPQRIQAPGLVPFPLVVAIFLGLSGTAVCVLSWTRRIRPELMLDIGLLFEVMVGFAISVSESATPWPPDHPIRGLSWNCLWITSYVVAIPGTYGKTVLAAFAAACMGPFGLLVATVANQNPIPTPAQLAVLLLPPFAVAGWSIPVARSLNRLGRQVSKARAMGSYELLELIGRGGMGEVWRARHRMLARTAAVKVIRPEVLEPQDPHSGQLLLRRFEREARVIAALRSPHTVVLYDYGVTGDGHFYYAMELLDGLDLDALVQRFGPQPAGRVVWLLKQAAKSLDEAHRAGLVHRDIKPRNIFCCRMGSDDDFVKVLDFGLVKVRVHEETQTQLTCAGVTTGTPAYMAPEVASGSLDVDGRADLYSLGCVAYWLLTGQLVFDASSAMGAVLAHLQATPVPPSMRCGIQVPSSLERLVLACLEKDPAHRPATAREFMRLLDACADVEPWSQQDAERWWFEHLPVQATAAVGRL